MNPEQPHLRPQDQKDIVVAQDTTHVEEKHDDLLPAATQKGTEFLDSQMKSDFDHLTVRQTISVYRYAIAICFLAAFSASTDGYQFQISGNIIANQGFIRQFRAEGETAIRPEWISIFNGIFSFGQVIGQFSTQFISEWIGRRKAVFVIMGVLVINTIVECISRQWYVWTIGKLLAGIGIGAVQATLPVFINEHAPAKIRGFLVVSYTMWWSIGGFIAVLVLKVRSDMAPLDWLTPVYTQFAMIGINTIIFVFLPETPWWAARKGKLDLLRKILTRTSKGIPNYDIDKEIAIILNTIEAQREQARRDGAESSLAMLKGLNLKRFLIGCWPLVLQQFVGLAVFSSNAAYFFQIAGYNDPFLATLCIRVSSLVSVIADALLVDKIGRRRMTVLGFSWACVGVTLIAIISLLDYETPELGAALIFGGVLANFFNTFQSSTAYAYLTECSELRFKARATGWGLAYCNLYAVVINFTLPLMLQAWSIRAAWFFVCLGIPGTVIAFLIMPETSRRSPAEIQEMFVERVPLRKWRTHKTAVERDLEVRMSRPVVE